MKEPAGLNRLQDDAPATAAMTACPPDHPMEQAALAWLARRYSGRWSTADDDAHADWLAAHPDHPAAWRRAEALWRELSGLRPFAAAEMHALRARPTAAPRRGGAAGLAFAGVAALALGIAWLLPGSFVPAQIHQTARGEHRTVTLADGSRIELNTASRIEIDYGLGCRCVRLPDGEAVFHVAHGDPRPFRVAASQGGLRDIGTAFWVRSQAQRVDVAVLEGKVETTPREGHLPTPLVAGERQAWNHAGETLPATARAIDDLLAWREGALVFRDAPLTDVVAEFARYHPVAIELDARLAHYRLSGRLPSTDLDGLVRLIRSAYAVEIRRPANGRLSIGIRSAHGQAMR